MGNSFLFKSLGSLRSDVHILLFVTYITYTIRDSVEELYGIPISLVLGTTKLSKEVQFLIVRRLGLKLPSRQTESFRLEEVP